MKKFIAAVITAFVMAGGLVAVSGSASPAAAACGDYNQAACVKISLPTNKQVSLGSYAKWKKNTSQSVAMTYFAPAGTKAKVTIQITGPKVKVKKSFKSVRPGDLKSVQVVGKSSVLLKRGKYKITVWVRVDDEGKAEKKVYKVTVK